MKRHPRSYGVELYDRCANTPWMVYYTLPGAGSSDGWGPVKHVVRTHATKASARRHKQRLERRQEADLYERFALGVPA